MQRLLTGMAMGLLAGCVLSEVSPGVKKMVQEGKRKLQQLKK